MFYQLYEINHAAVQPLRAFADAVKLFYSNPLNPLSHTHWGRTVAATAELFERTTRRYGKPSFDLVETVVDWKTVPVTEKVVFSGSSGASVFCVTSETVISMLFPSGPGLAAFTIMAGFWVGAGADLKYPCR